MVDLVNIFLHHVGIGLRAAHRRRTQDIVNKPAVASGKPDQSNGKLVFDQRQIQDTRDLVARR